MRTAKNPIRAFDGTRREVMGEIELELLIGLGHVSGVFSNTRYSMRVQLSLGGDHGFIQHGIVPSSLHQKVRFVVDDKLVTVHGETDFKVYHETAIPYVEPECKEESSFHTLELVSMVHVPVGSLMGTPELSKPALAGWKDYARKRVQPWGRPWIAWARDPKPIEAGKGVKREGLGYQRSQDNRDQGDYESRDNGGRGYRGGRGGYGVRGNDGGRGGYGGQGNNGGRSGRGGRGSNGGRGNHGGQGSGQGDHGGHI
ncbi:hypothetical protein NL676_032472 [Syzygium grande]|nr:hypothetical protein NL676_032472 [Syzygium grande]